MDTNTQVRVSKEFDELAIKISALQGFLQQPKPDFVSIEAYALLNSQLTCMKQYLNILDSRLELARQELADKYSQ